MTTEPMGPPDATRYDAEELLRSWFHWWRQSRDVPTSLPEDLHVSTAAFLAALAVRRGHKIYGPENL